MPRQSPPSGPLAGFPEHRVAPGGSLFRIHLAVNDTWWFSSDGSGRFDLEAPRGACYLAEHPAGAFVEVFRGIRVIAARDVEDRHLSTIALTREIRLADMTAPSALRFGVTGAMHSTDDYGTTQRWAAELAATHFDGIRYYCGHDPSARELAVAVFGATGAPVDRDAWPPPAARGPIPQDVLDEVEDRFGILILPAPGT